MKIMRSKQLDGLSVCTSDWRTGCLACYRRTRRSAPPSAIKKRFLSGAFELWCVLQFSWFPSIQYVRQMTPWNSLQEQYQWSSRITKSRISGQELQSNTSFQRQLWWSLNQYRCIVAFLEALAQTRQGLMKLSGRRCTLSWSIELHRISQKCYSVDSCLKAETSALLHDSLTIDIQSK